MKSGAMRKILVIGQFSISIAFIICSAIVYKQLEFIRTTDLGFDRENKVVIPVNLPGAARARTMELLKHEFQRLPGVESVARTNSVPGQLRGIADINKQGMPLEESVNAAFINVDFDYISTLGITLLDGREFSKELATDSTNSILLNERAAELLGMPQAGEDFRMYQNIGNNAPAPFRTGTVIGIVKNLYYEPMYRIIEPMALILNIQRTNFLVVSINGDVPTTLAEMENIWNGSVTGRPFDPTFLDEDILRIYESEERLSDVVLAFTFLAIAIACLGLFGLASFTAEQRTKEIGVRKVLGATETGIVYLLSKEFLKLVLISNLIAWPVSYFAARNWLDNFTHRADIGFLVFFLASAAALIISQITVSYQALRAAGINPVKALKYE